MKHVGFVLPEALDNELEECRMFLRGDMNIRAICIRALKAAAAQCATRKIDYDAGYSSYDADHHSAETKALVKAIMLNTPRSRTNRLRDCMTAMQCTNEPDYWLGYFTAMSE